MFPLQTEHSKFNRIIRIMLLSTILIISYGCKRSQFIQFTNTQYNFELQEEGANQNINSELSLIYYFDGGCGQCLLNVKKLGAFVEKEYPDINLILLSSCELNSEAKRMIDILSIREKIFEEEKDAIIVRKKDLALNQIILIDKKNRLLFSSLSTEEEVLRKLLSRSMGL